MMNRKLTSALLTAISATALTAITVFAAGPAPAQPAEPAAEAKPAIAINYETEVSYEAAGENNDGEDKRQKLNIKTDEEGNMYAELENGERVYLSTTEPTDIDGDITITARN